MKSDVWILVYRLGKSSVKANIRYLWNYDTACTAHVLKAMIVAEKNIDNVHTLVHKLSQSRKQRLAF